MKFISSLSTFTTNMMLKLAQFPGLGFLAVYVHSASSVKGQFGGKIEDYAVYLELGQQVIDDAKAGPGGAKPKGSRGGSQAAEDVEVENIYDDFEDGGESSGVYLPSDDYPRSDDRHSYFDDDYRAL